MDIEKNTISDNADTLTTDKSELAKEADTTPADPQQTAALLPISDNAVVDAGAGAGKTTTLARKVAHLVCNTDMKADRIAIMTFTRNAAAELRVRMNRELSEASAKESSPEKKMQIREQMVRFKNAPICTINSFCLEVLKENIQLFDLPANFTILDETKAKMMFSQAIDTAMEQFYSDKVCTDKSRCFTPEERDVLFRLFSYKDDQDLRRALAHLHSSVVNLKNYNDWLDRCTANGDQSKGLIADHTKQQLQSVFDKLTTAIDKKASTADIRSLSELSDALTKDKKLLEDFRDLINEKLDDGMTSEKLDSFIKNSLDTALKYEDINCTSTTQKAKKATDSIIKLRNDSKTAIAELPKLISDNCTDDQNSIICTLVKLLKLCDSEYQQMKAEQGCVDFSDCEQKLYNELCKADSQLKKSLIKKYDIIIIDEFQDTNDTQYAIFEQLTGEDSPCSLFVVGDIKQSIYAFRGGDPSIMASLCDDEAHFKHITLRNNYRSRKSVISSVNAVLGKLMTKERGDVDYNSDVELVYGNTSYDIVNQKLAAYLTTDAEPVTADDIDNMIYNTELHVLKTSKDNDKIALEANFIANRISMLVNGFYSVADKSISDGAYRSCSYGDIGILVRKKKHIPTLKKALEAKGIPVSSIGDPFLEADEITLILNYLRIIDNPMREKELLATLMSPLYCMDAEKIAAIKLGCIGFDLEKAHLDAQGKQMLKKLFTTFRPLYSAVSAAAKPFDTYKAAKKNDEDYLSAEERINKVISTVFNDKGEKRGEDIDIDKLRSYEDSLQQFFIDYYKYNRSADDCYIQLTMLRDLYLLLEKNGAVREQGDKDCIRFMDELTKFRSYRSNNSVERLVRKVYNDTSLLSVVTVLGDSDKKIANLHLLLKRIADFEASGSATLNDFLRYVDKAIKLNDTKTFEEASVATGGNSVRIMTIHASKGLEMPVVFLALMGESTDGGINTPYEFNPHIGIATKSIDLANRKLIDTAYYSALKAHNAKKEISEELRLLYVAMTRAREKLIMSGSVSVSALGGCGTKITSGDVDSIFSKGSPIFWVLAALFSESGQKIDYKGNTPDNAVNDSACTTMYFYDMRPQKQTDADAANADATSSDEADTRFDSELVEYRDSITPVAIPAPLPANEAYARRIADNIIRKYANEMLTTARSRYSVTEVAHMMETNSFSDDSPDRVYISSPDFVSKNGFTGKEVGDAYHHAMQFFPFDSDPEKAETELEELYGDAHITEKEYDYLKGHSDKFAAFLRSDLCKRAVAASQKLSDNLQRERSFFTQVSTSKLGLSSEKENTDVFLQGRIDMFFIEDDGVVLVDYKSDTPQNLVKELDAYKKQLRMYNDVLFELTGKPVKEIYIYAFSLPEEQRTIKIEPKE